MSQQIGYRTGNRLYIQLTGRCTLECSFCPRSRGRRRIGAWDLGQERSPTPVEIQESLGDPSGYREVVFSGLGEPTLRLNVLLATAETVKRRGGRVRLDTDGLANLVHDRDVLPAMAGLVDSISVSMNAQDPETYETQCRPNLPGSFAAMTAFVAEAARLVPEVSATAVCGLPGVDLAACERLARSLGAGFRARRPRDLL